MDLNYSIKSAFILNVALATYVLVSGLEYSIFNTISVILLATICAYYACLQEKKGSAAFSWFLLVGIIGISVVVGNVNEWYQVISSLLHGYSVVAMILACASGIAFFRMLLDKAEEVYNMLREGELTTQAFLVALTFVVNMVFWYCLITHFYTIPWYVHLSLGILSVLFSFFNGINDAKEAKENSIFAYIAMGLDKILLYSFMFAHFGAEGAIAGVEVKSFFRPVMVFFSTTQEAIMDIPPMYPHKHGNSDDHPDKNDQNEKSCNSHDHNHNDKNDQNEEKSWVDYSSSALFSICYAACVAFLGYSELPKALELFKINTKSIGIEILIFIILISGAASCFLVNFNSLIGGDHDHGAVTPFKSLYSSTGCCKIKNPSLKNSLRFFLSLNGAVLTSSVGVLISSQLFNLPVWFSIIMILFAFIVEFMFHFYSQYKLSADSHDHPHKLSAGSHDHPHKLSADSYKTHGGCCFFPGGWGANRKN